MAYIGANHIGVKKNQDRTYFNSDTLIICDGIGQFNDSAVAAEILIENISMATNENEIKGMLDRTVYEIITRNIEGGTTCIMARLVKKDDLDYLNLFYLGNGGAIHLHGDYNEFPKSYQDIHKPYRYSNLIIPHVDKEGILLRYISNHSNPEDIIPTFLNLSLNGTNGDIVVVFTDGISSLEDDIIVEDEHKRLWRNQSSIINTILQKLNYFIMENLETFSNEKLSFFIGNLLNELKTNKDLEDDASIGVLVTQEVINYYKQKSNVKEAF